MGLDYDKYAWGDLSTMLPGVALKFFRDGQNSGNIHSMHSFKGNANPNFFLNNFSNHLPEDNTVAFKFPASKFATASKYALTLGLRDFSTKSEDG